MCRRSAKMVSSKYLTKWDGPDLLLLFRLPEWLHVSFLPPHFPCCLTSELQDFVEKMPVGCFLPHAYDPIPLEFREKDSQNGNDSNPNPIGEAHSVFHDEPDIISRAEVPFDRA
jgi:hypothetical protein